MRDKIFLRRCFNHSFTFATVLQLLFLYNHQTDMTSDKIQIGRSGVKKIELLGVCGDGGRKHHNCDHCDCRRNNNNSNNIINNISVQGNRNATGQPLPHQSSPWSNYVGSGCLCGGARYCNGNFSSLMISGPRRNSRNFHGSMTPDMRMEQRLFHSGDIQTIGINFDDYDEIPCEVTGNNLPLPIETLTIETIGEDLYRNTQLCGFCRPTPVQKYSIPIGQQGRYFMACSEAGSGV